MVQTSPGLQCRQAIVAAERAAQLPPHLLAAIGRVESGRRDPQSGTVNPWPWSINVEGDDYIYETEAQAIAAVRGFQAEGHRSIDVGCMQINLMHHPDAFPSLEQAFDPTANAIYAAAFLNQLHQQTGSWDRATAWYHSATPGVGDDYLRKVSAALPEEARVADTAPGPLTVGRSMGMPMPMGMAMAMAMDHPRMIPMAGMGGGSGVGRSLDSYRSYPVMLASRK